MDEIKDARRRKRHLSLAIRMTFFTIVMLGVFLIVFLNEKTRPDRLWILILIGLNGIVAIGLGGTIAIVSWRRTRRP